jgi:hypothetical protein
LVLAPASFILTNCNLPITWALYVNGVCMKFFLPILLLLLKGCSTMTFNSNADVYVKNKIESHIRKSDVGRYTNGEVWKLGGSQVGYVETNYCQVDFRDINPSRETLISELEIKAQKLGGNALVLDSCLVNKSTATCNTYTQCRGMAYLITYNK